MQNSERATYPAFSLNTADSGLYTLESNRSIPEFLEVAKQSQFQVFHLEGQTITSRDRYFQMMADLFQFPDYFGNNWDAVADCLTDFSWEEGDRIIVVYSNCQGFCKGNDWVIAMKIWTNTIEFWQQQGVMLSVILG